MTREAKAAKERETWAKLWPSQTPEKSVPLLQALHAAGIPCAVASSSSVEEIRHRLGHVDVLKYFRCISAGDEVTHGKPDPETYLRCLAQLQRSHPELEAGDCLVFEDSRFGIASAHAASMCCVAVHRSSTSSCRNGRALRRSSSRWCEAAIVI